jgi:hypothetical protein
MCGDIGVWGLQGPGWTAVSMWWVGHKGRFRVRGRRCEPLPTHLPFLAPSVSAALWGRMSYIRTPGPSLSLAPLPYGFLAPCPSRRLVFASRAASRSLEGHGGAPRPLGDSCEDSPLSPTRGYTVLVHGRHSGPAGAEWGRGAGWGGFGRCKRNTQRGGIQALVLTRVSGRWCSSAIGGHTVTGGRGAHGNVSVFRCRT